MTKLMHLPRKFGVELFRLTEHKVVCVTEFITYVCKALTQCLLIARLLEEAELFVVVCF